MRMAGNLSAAPNSTRSHFRHLFLQKCRARASARLCVITGAVVANRPLEDLACHDRRGLTSAEGLARDTGGPTRSRRGPLVRSSVGC